MRSLWHNVGQWIYNDCVKSSHKYHSTSPRYMIGYSFSFMNLINQIGTKLVTVAWDTIKYNDAIICSFPSKKAKLKATLCLAEIPCFYRLHLWEMWWYLCPLCFFPLLHPLLFHKRHTLALLHVYQWQMEDSGLQGHEEESGALRPIGSSGFKPRGHRQRRAVISPGWRMNTFAWDEQERDTAALFPPACCCITIHIQLWKKTF